MSFSSSYSSFEMIMVKIGWVDPLYGILTYRPPGIFFRTVKLSRIIIVGYFNIHVDILSNNTAEEFQSFMDFLNFVQHVCGPTHTAGHTLHLVFTYGITLDYLHIKEVAF